MNILGIDTATMAGSIAVITEQQLIAEITVNTKTEFPNHMPPAAGFLLSNASMASFPSSHPDPGLGGKIPPKAK